MTSFKNKLPPGIKNFLRALRNFGYARRGARFAHTWRDATAHVFLPARISAPPPNPFWAYFDEHTQGNGIWKWQHYFEVYQRHLSKFIGQPAHLVEIGIYSGGSLEMWAACLGPACHVYGVDIEPACQIYARENISVFIGDQQDPNFWAQFRQQVPQVDILIDDGGHSTVQQMVTLEQMLPHLAPNGVYICEDVHGIQNGFAAYVQGLVTEFNALVKRRGASDGAPNAFQASCLAIHWYPYLVVIEKRAAPATQFASVRRGTHWQPFLK